MKDIEFSKEIREHKYFTKIEDNTWLVQSNPKSRCQAYFVTVLPHAIVMYGDYDGVIVKPHEAGRENLINWMAGATTLSYFCEKVHNGNQYHQYMEFNEDICLNSCLENFMNRFEIDYDLKPFLEKAIKERDNYDEIQNIFEQKLSLLLECHVDNLEETYNNKFRHKYLHHKDEVNYENMVKLLTDVLDVSFENEWVFYEWMQEHDFYDVEEHEYRDYTHQIKWQHQCLLWWANNVLSKNNGGDVNG